MRFWRISNFTDLSGMGSALHGARWNRKGLPVVYLADHPSTSMLETLVHFRSANLPDTFQLLAIEAPDSTTIEEISPPVGWSTKVKLTQKLGSNFLEFRDRPLLRVPSVVMPQAFNYLLNPAHPDAAQFCIAQVWRYPFDSRLLS